MTVQINDNSRLIDTPSVKAEFDAISKTYLENIEKYKDLEKVIKKCKADIESLVCRHFKLDKPESAKTYTTLEYAVFYKKESEQVNIDKDLLRLKYPEIYAEVTTVTVKKPAFDGIKKI